MCPEKINVPANEWYGDTHIELEFPNGWVVHEQRMAGHDARPLSSRAIEDKLQQPVGSPPLSVLAKGKRRCVIIFDDMTRPTKTWQMLPPILSELRRGGMTDNRISFVMATGAHGARMLPDFAKKLGESIIERFCVFNHNPYENLVEVGKTSHGTDVKINREVMNCDLKVAVGALIPHGEFGFGGGAKIVLPGVAGIETIWHNHALTHDLDARLDAEEAARMVGLDFVVNALLNADRDVSDLICGDMVKAHRKGVEVAARHYATPIFEDSDISITSGYPMANEGYKAYKIARDSVRGGGDVVFLVYSPEGSRVHYYNGRFGMDFGGRGWGPDMYVPKPWKMGRVIVVSPNLMKAEELYYGEGSTWVKSWSEALRMLEEKHGSRAEVAIYPCATMQISEKESEELLSKFGISETSPKTQRSKH